MTRGPTGDKKTKIPLKWRLSAWWNGYDLDDVRARLSQHMTSTEVPGDLADLSALSTPPSQSSPQVNRVTPQYESKISHDVEKNDTEIEFSDDHVVVKAVWDTQRAHVAQVFWGDGFCGPGGPEQIIKITEPLNINSKRSTMVIGAGLGGPVRALQKNHKTPVDGFESSERLAIDGMQMSVDAGIAQDAPILQLDFENITEFSRRYDRAYSKESLFTIENKMGLIDTIYDHLKKDGLFLLTDYVLAESADPNTALFEKWRLIEPEAPKPITAGDLRGLLTNAGFSLQVNDNITDLYLDLIAQARTHALKVLNAMEKDGAHNLSLIKYMHNEAAFWDIRAKLLRNGDLRVMKYMCLKSS